jgi:hypothetical protein
MKLKRVTENFKRYCGYTIINRHGVVWFWGTIIIQTLDDYKRKSK